MFAQKHLMELVPDPLWAAWFVGFIDGEGSFQIMISGRHPDGQPRNLVPHLAIALREDDRGLLEEIRYTLGIGRLYQVSKHGDRKKGIRSKDQAMWRCDNLAELIGTLIPLFEAFPPRGKKRVEYEIWREAVILKSRAGMCGDLLNLKEQLMQAREFKDNMQPVTTQMPDYVQLSIFEEVP